MPYAEQVTVDDVTYDIRDAAAVRFDGVQSLTNAQKQQARENIGAGVSVTVADHRLTITEG